VKIPKLVAQRTLDDLPARLTRAIEEIPSPWVKPAQAQTFREMVEASVARLASAGRPRRSTSARAGQKP